MGLVEFNIEFKQFLDSICERVKTKQYEYASYSNPFHNFEMAAKLNNSNPQIELHRFLTKHLVSYLDLIEDLKVGSIPEQNYVDEKIGDIIAYLTILRTMIKEKNNPIELPF